VQSKALNQFFLAIPKTPLKAQLVPSYWHVTDIQVLDVDIDDDKTFHSK